MICPFGAQSSSLDLGGEMTQQQYWLSLVCLTYTGQPVLLPTRVAVKWDKWRKVLEPKVGLKYYRKTWIGQSLSNAILVKARNWS